MNHSRKLQVERHPAQTAGGTSQDTRPGSRGTNLPRPVRVEWTAIERAPGALVALPPGQVLMCAVPRIGCDLWIT